VRTRADRFKDFGELAFERGELAAIGCAQGDGAFFERSGLGAAGFVERGDPLIVDAEQRVLDSKGFEEGEEEAGGFDAVGIEVGEDGDVTSVFKSLGHGAEALTGAIVP